MALTLPNPTSIVSGVNVSSLTNGLGWAIAGIILVVAIAGIIFWYFNKKAWTKQVWVFDLIGGAYVPIVKDAARLVAIGSGGFQVLYLKKLKVYRIGYGGRVAKDMYFFMIMPDGYWLNCVLDGKITSDGRIPIKASSVNVRAQYTSLEKQIEALVGSKESWWAKHGSTVLAFAFFGMMGIFAYLYFQQWTAVTKAQTDITQQLSTLVDTVNRLLISAKSGGATTTQAVGQVILALIR